jgi:glutamate N-acetyltransferase/amino-acid N-acetyltransferase
MVVNSGNANACTGAAGLRDARTMCRVTAKLLGVKEHEVLVASTGMIGRTLPMDKVLAGIERAAARLSAGAQAGRDFARAILTTDAGTKTATETYSVDLSKGAGRAQGRVAGAAKGAGMIRPDMATMLAFLTTDAALPTARLRRALRDAVAPSFNAITVDGHTSTNDSVFLFSSATTGTSGNATFEKNFNAALTDVCKQLAEAIVLDGEGATKATAVTVTGARSHAAAERIARTVAESPLLRCALFASDPNWGRIVSAVGYAEGVGSVDKLACAINGTTVFHKLKPTKFDRNKVARSMRTKRVTITIDLAEGRGSYTVLTSDLTYDYIKCNAGVPT